MRWFLLVMLASCGARCGGPPDDGRRHMTIYLNPGDGTISPVPYGIPITF